CALALGALTVGLGFKNEIADLTENNSGYDLVMNNPRAEDQPIRHDFVKYGKRFFKIASYRSRLNISVTTSPLNGV
ncbi:hypothetical protein, partial [Enterococcus faecium]|uniref:hypothetical protein n=1 Tax=Enterococcus faecium TaxID=1352 RepID=UPI0012683FF2